MVDALIIDACRTPRGIGKAGKGALSGIHPQQLGATVLRALADRTGINTADVDDIVWGTSSQRGQQSGDLGRMSALDAGYDARASAVTSTVCRVMVVRPIREKVSRSSISCPMRRAFTFTRSSACSAEVQLDIQPVATMTPSVRFGPSTSSRRSMLKSLGR